MKKRPFKALVVVCLFAVMAAVVWNCAVAKKKSMYRQNMPRPDGEAPEDAGPMELPVPKDSALQKQTPPPKAQKKKPKPVH